MKLKILALSLCLSLSAPAMAGAGSAIGPFPPLGSSEEINDYNTLMNYQLTRTKKQCDLAGQEASANLEVFYGKLLTPAELVRAKSKFKWLTVKTGLIILTQKKKYDRPRPYISHTDIKPCIELEGSTAYPSGHTTLGRVYGRVLSAMYPDRSDKFMKRSDVVALNRVIGGVHHPSDIEAGKKLGDAIADDYLDSGDKFYDQE